MNFLSSYRLGRRKKSLKITSKKYEAGKSNMFHMHSISDIAELSRQLNVITSYIRKYALRAAREIRPPRGLVNKIGFCMGYLERTDEMNVSVGDSENVMQRAYDPKTPGFTNGYESWEHSEN